MKKFDYSTTTLNEYESEFSHLRQQGEFGWELVAVTKIVWGCSSDRGTTYYWKRERLPSP